MPEGRVDQTYSSFPFLRSITPNMIRITPASADHINRVFTARLYDLNLDIHTRGKSLENNILNAIRQAIVKGIIVRILPAEDAYNPNDKVLDIMGHIDLRTIDPQLEGMAELKILCRLSVSRGILTLRSIQRNFTVHIEREYDENEDVAEYDEPQDYDYPDYDQD